MTDYRSLKSNIDEKRDDAIVFTFGRFQPPTSGHELLINNTIKEAKKRGFDHRIYTSLGQDNKKNPLTFKEKLKFLKRFFPKANIMNDSKIRNPFDVAEKLSDEGYKTVIMVVGSDRVKEFKDGIGKYIGPDGYDFDTFEVVSAGGRDPDAEGVVGMSASKMRSAVIEDDIESFKSGLPARASSRDAFKLFNLIKSGLDIKESISEGISNTQLKTIAKNKEVKTLLKDLYREPHETIGIALLSIPHVEDVIGVVTNKLIQQFISKVPMIMSFARIVSHVEPPQTPKLNEAETIHWNTLKRKERESLLNDTGFPKSFAKDKWKNLDFRVKERIGKMIHKTTKGEYAIKECIDVNKKYLNYLKEQKNNKKKDDMIVIALTKSEGGDSKDTVSKIEKSCKSLSLPFYAVQIGDAFVVDDDLNDDKMIIHNYDGNSNKLKITASKTCCFVRGGALVDISGRGLIKSLEESGIFMINTLSEMELCQNKFMTAVSLQKANIPHPRTSLVMNDESIDIALERIGGKFPVIVKTITGAEGIGVMIVDSMASLKSVLQGLWKYEAEIIMQEYMHIGYDVRTLVLDGEIFASVKRIKSKKGDFRTNRSLGNETEPYILSEKEKDIILRAAKNSGCYYCGVDHVTVGGKLYILEVNGSPGSGAASYMSYYGDSDKKVTGDKLIDNLVSYISDKDNWSRTKQVVGIIEKVKVEGIEFKAKMDTGNGSHTSIHATDIKKLSDTRVSFKIEKKKFIKPIIEMKRIHFGGGQREERFVVELDMSLGQHASQPTLFMLDDRSENIYSVLIGKRYLKKHGLIVDVAKTFTLGDTKQINKLETIQSN